jgi:hypothetical protein
LEKIIKYKENKHRLITDFVKTHEKKEKNFKEATKLYKKSLNEDAEKFVRSSLD